MMARKLSIVAGHGILIHLALAGTASAQDARSEGKVRVTAPGAILPNPFAPGAQRPESVAVEPGAPHRGPVTYHNPFPNMSTAPPINMSMLPGPVSRWRRPNLPNTSSGVKTAILSTDEAKPLRPNWDQLPPAEQLIASGEFHKSTAPTADGTRAEEDGSTIRFAPESLTQPTWFAEPREKIRPLPPPVESFNPEPTAIATPAPALADGSRLNEGDGLESFNTEPTATGGGWGGAQRPPSFTGGSPTARPQPPNSLHEPSPAASEIAPATPIIAKGQPRPTASEVDLPHVISDYADTPEGWFTEAQHLAQTAKSLDELNAIVALCQRALSHGPDAKLAMPLRRLAGWAHNRCGELLIDAGQHGEALRNFQIAVALDPSSSLAIHNRAVTLAQQNDVEGALRDFNRVIELNPGLSIAYRNRAELLASMGRAGEAVRDYSHAMEGLPDDSQLYQARGAAWQRLGDFGKAIADLNRAIDLDPQSAEAYTQRGNLAAEQGNFEQALADLHQALNVDALAAEAYRSLAWLRATCPDERYRDSEQAIAAAERAVKLAGPADCFVLDALAAAQASAGKFEEAVRTQEQAIAAAPPDYSEPLRERLNLYQQGQPYLAAPAGQIQHVSHESE